MFEEWLNEFDFSKGGIDFLEMFAKPEDSQGLLDIGLVLRNGHLMFLHLALNLHNLTACRDLPVLHDDISNPTARDNHDGNAEKDKGRKPKAGSAFFTVHFLKREQIQIRSTTRSRELRDLGLRATSRAPGAIPLRVRSR